jgi:hypothetical protein
MRTITIYKNVYKYEELDKQAQEKVRRWLAEDGQYYYDEIIDSVKAILQAIGASAGRTWDDISADYENVTGVRAYKYIFNNYIYPNRKAKFLRWSEKQGKPMYSRLQYVYDCNFTGAWSDNILWDSWQEWQKDFRKHNVKQDVEDFFIILSGNISKEFSKAEEWLYSDEYAKDMCNANSYEFDEYGKIA